MSVSSILTGDTRNELRVALIGAESGEREIERVGRWMRTCMGGKELSVWEWS